MVTCAGVAGWSLGFDKYLREFRQVYENSRTWYASLVIIAVCHRQRTCNMGNSVAISKSFVFRPRFRLVLLYWSVIHISFRLNFA